jgi:hypothetical protein
LNYFSQEAAAAQGFLAYLVEKLEIAFYAAGIGRAIVIDARGPRPSSVLVFHTALADIRRMLDGARRRVAA